MSKADSAFRPDPNHSSRRTIAVKPDASALALASIAALGALLFWRAMPETRNATTAATANGSPAKTVA